MHMMLPAVPQEHGEVTVSFPQSPQTLLSFLGDNAGVEGPGEHKMHLVLLVIYTEELLIHGGATWSFSKVNDDFFQKPPPWFCQCSETGC